MKADPTLLSTDVATKRRYRGKNVAMRVESTFFALGEDFENKTRSCDGHSGFFCFIGCLKFCFQSRTKMFLKNFLKAFIGLNGLFVQ